MKKIDKVIKYFRNLKEETPIAPSGQVSLPTNNVGNQGIAMFDPLMNFFKRTKKRKNGEYDNRFVPKNYRKWLNNK